jgi:hypothetical protein
MLAIVMGSVLMVTCIYPAPITAMRIAGDSSVPAISSGSEAQIQVNCVWTAVCNECLNNDCRQRPRQSYVIASAGAGTGMRLGVPPITYFHMTSTFVVRLDEYNEPRRLATVRPRPTLAKHLNYWSLVRRDCPLRVSSDKWKLTACRGVSTPPNCPP